VDQLAAGTYPWHSRALAPVLPLDRNAAVMSTNRPEGRGHAKHDVGNRPRDRHSSHGSIRYWYTAQPSSDRQATTPKPAASRARPSSRPRTRGPSRCSRRGATSCQSRTRPQRTSRRPPQATARDPASTIFHTVITSPANTPAEVPTPARCRSSVCRAWCTAHSASRPCRLPLSPIACVLGVPRSAPLSGLDSAVQNPPLPYTGTRSWKAGVSAATNSQSPCFEVPQCDVPADSAAEPSPGRPMLRSRPPSPPSCRRPR
jgi:hypothetical protein